VRNWLTLVWLFVRWPVSQEGKASRLYVKNYQLTCWCPIFSSTLVLLYCPSQYGTATHFFFSIEFGAIWYITQKLVSLVIMTHWRIVKCPAMGCCDWNDFNLLVNIWSINTNQVAKNFLIRQLTHYTLVCGGIMKIGPELAPNEVRSAEWERVNDWHWLWRSPASHQWCLESVKSRQFTLF
jgi:hypothetical protein